jgi:hypothetical protein
MSATCDPKRDAKGKRRRVVLGITCGAVVALLLLVGLGIIIWRVIAARVDVEKFTGAAAISRAFEHALQDGYLTDAYRLTTHRFQQQVSIDEFKELINRYPALRGPEEAPYNYHGKVDHTFGSDQFTFETEVLDHGHTAIFTYVIVKEDAQWKVDSVVFKPESNRGSEK